MVAERDGSLYEGAELVFGIVAPVGTDLDRFIEILTVELRRFRYDVNPVRLSELAVSLLDRPAMSSAAGGEVARLKSLMDAGNEVRAIGDVSVGGSAWGIAAAGIGPVRAVHRPGAA